MTVISSYVSLQEAIVEELNRTGDTSVSGQVDLFIQLLERSLRRDERFRRISVDSDFAIAAGATVALPSDYAQIKAWTHNGPTWYGLIETIGFDRLGELTRSLGLTGVPQYAAVDDVNKIVYLAPAADAEYSTTFVYESKIEPLATASNNWILTNHPDVYFYGALIHSAPFLKDDSRLPVWMGLYEAAASEVDADTTRAQFSGVMRQRIRPIGG